MEKKQTGWPFLEGYASDAEGEFHVFTDYRWNDETVIRLWKVDPHGIDLKTVVVRPFSLNSSDEATQ